MKRNTICFTILSALAILLLFLNIYIGTVRYNFTDVTAAVFGSNTDSNIKNIVLQIRLPRALSAFLLGGALAVSGYLLQTFFANPIAGPFVLGISSGAKLAVALSMIFGIQFGIILNSYILIISAFVGSLFAMGIVLLFSGKTQKSSTLIICGIMIGYICSAITDFLVTLADDSQIVNLHNWSLGSFSGINMGNIGIIFFITIISLFFCILISKQIDAFRLGEIYAKNLGVNIKRFRIELVILSSILSGLVTAFAGPISFVGIAVPYLVKAIFKTSKSMVIIPSSFLGGGIFCLFSDLIARMILAPSELSISTVTAVFGAPVVIWIMTHKKRT